MPLYDESGKAIIPKTRTHKTKSPLSIKETEFKERTYTPPIVVSKTTDIITKEKLKTDISRIQVDVVRTPFVHAGEKTRAILQLQGTKRQVSDFPKGTTFIPTKTGYDVKIPESAKLDWSRYYRKESQALPIGASETSRFGSGLVQSMFAITKPVADILGFGKKFDKMATVGMSVGLHPFDAKGVTESYVKGTHAGRYGIHYPSTLDIGFEHIGWSPKGSSEFVRSDPFFFAGGVGGEVAQSIAFTAALRPVGHGIKIGAKGVIKKVPDIYSKFSKVFPEEKLFRPTVRKTSSIIAKGQSDLFGRLFKWGGKGYQFGKKVIPYAPKHVDEVVKGAFYSKTVSQKTILGGGKRAVRTLMSPDEYLSAKKTLSKYLSKKPTYDIMFPRSAEGLQPFIHKTGAYRVAWGGKLVRKSKYIYSGITPEGKLAFSTRPGLAAKDISGKYFGLVKEFRQGQKQIYSNFDQPGIVQYKPLVKEFPTISMKLEKTSDIFDLMKGTRTLGYDISAIPGVKKVVYHHGIVRRGVSPEWASEVSRMLEKGYRPSPFSSLIKGTGKPLMKDITSLAQKERTSWMFRQKMRFWESVSGMQQVIPKPSLTTLKTRTRNILFPQTNLGHGAISLPSKSLEPILGQLTHVGMKTGTGYIDKFKVKEITLSSFDHSAKKVKPVIAQIQMPVQDTVVEPVTSLTQIQTPIHKPELDIFFSQGSTGKPKIAKPIPFPFPTTTKRMFPILPIMPPSGLYGRGKMFYDPEIYGLKYKYREFNIPSLSKISKQITKGMKRGKPLI